MSGKSLYLPLSGKVHWQNKFLYLLYTLASRWKHQEKQSAKCHI